MNMREIALSRLNEFNEWGDKADEVDLNKLDFNFVCDWFKAYENLIQEMKEATIEMKSPDFPNTDYEWASFLDLLNRSIKHSKKLCNAPFIK